MLSNCRRLEFNAVPYTIHQQYSLEWTMAQYSIRKVSLSPPHFKYPTTRMRLRASLHSVFSTLICVLKERCESHQSPRNFALIGRNSETIHCRPFLYSIYFLLQMALYGVQEAATKTDRQVIKRSTLKISRVFTWYEYITQQCKQAMTSNQVFCETIQQFQLVWFTVDIRKIRKYRYAFITWFGGRHPLSIVTTVTMNSLWTVKIRTAWWHWTLLQIWIRLNPSMDKRLHFGWKCSFIPKL